MRETMDEYLLSGVIIILMSKLERYRVASEVKHSVGNTVQDDNVRRYLWVGIQKISLSGYKTLRLMAYTSTAAIAEEVEIVNREISYYRELILDYLGWRCRG